MINEIKSAAVSLCAATFGQISPEISGYLTNPNLEMVNTALQHAAWLVAIIAGLVSIVNGTRRWFIKRH